MPHAHLQFLGKFIRDARLEHHLTQDRLAEAAGISKKYLTGIEKGVKNPSYCVLYQLFSVLQVPVNILFYPELCKADRLDEEKLLAAYRRCPDKDRHIIVHMSELLADELNASPNADSHET